MGFVTPFSYSFERLQRQVFDKLEVPAVCTSSLYNIKSCEETLNLSVSNEISCLSVCELFVAFNEFFLEFRNNFIQSTVGDEFGQPESGYQSTSYFMQKSEIVYNLEQIVENRS